MAKGRRQLIAALLAAGLFACPLSPALAATASAPAVGTAHPRGPWIVGPINAQASSGVGFCSMKNSYDDGKAVIFARDAEGSNSIAISFIDKMMQSGAQYPVTLSAEGLKRDMIALAATPKVMIIQMGLDRDFYTILRKKETIEIGFKDKKFSFQLGGTSEALDALTKCAIDVAAGKKFTPRSIAVASAAQEPLVIAPDTPNATAADLGKDFSVGEMVAAKTLRDELDRLRLENRKLMAENQAMTAKLIGQPSAVAATSDDIVGAELEAQEKDLRARNARLARDNARLKLREQQMLAESAQQAETPDAADGAAEDDAKVIGSQILASPDPATPIENDAAAQAARAVADAGGESQGIVKTTKRSAPASAPATSPAPAAAETFATLDGLDDALRPRDTLAASAPVPDAGAKAPSSLAASVSPSADAASFLSDNALVASMAPVNPAQLSPQAAAAPVVPANKASPDAPAQGRSAIAAAAAAPLISPSTSAPKANIAPAAKPETPVKMAAADPATTAQLAATAPAAGSARPALIETGDFLRDLLVSAGIQPARGGAGYSWQSNGVFGSAEERRLPEGRSLTELAANYAEQSKARCRGDFAHKETAVVMRKGLPTVESEIACIDGKHDAAAAMLFVQKDSHVAIVAHESMADKAENALSRRDAVAAALSE